MRKRLDSKLLKRTVHVDPRTFPSQGRPKSIVESLDAEQFHQIEVGLASSGRDGLLHVGREAGNVKSAGHTIGRPC